jgi:hypothetical protein
MAEKIDFSQRQFFAENSDFRWELFITQKAALSVVNSHRIFPVNHRKPVCPELKIFCTDQGFLNEMV